MPDVPGPLSARSWGVSDLLSVGLFGVGFAIEAAADWQLESHKQSGDSGLLKEGAWSIVSHPNYLGYALAHMVCPLLLWATPAFHPLVLFGPLANYVFLRYMGGDKENEASQKERYEKAGNQEKMQDLRKATEEKNSFWPAPADIKNTWLWTFVELGVIAVVVEEAARRL